MKTRNCAAIIPVALVAFAGAFICAGRAESESPEVGISKRTPWTTSQVTGSPDPPLPYTTERVFPKLKFNQCLDMVQVPGGNRFFIAEQTGKIFSFPNDPEVDKPDLVVDISKIDGVRSLYALTFHPEFQKNRYLYVCYIKAANLSDGTHIARFEVADTDPPTVDIATETTVITWYSGGHNGCCLKFGPDGCLYVSTGDGAPANPPDTQKAGQDVSNLLSAILRIDVDHPEDGRNYRIPLDNPFVELEDARGEIWAYGFRNPWRMSFDRRTGDLWVGDVGWELWEMLDRVERGGNYGWGVTEGREMTHPEWPRGPTPILPPTIDHPHSESSSITDGLTYYGSRLKQLREAHIYGDYDTGKFWSFRWKDGEVVDHQEIADTTLRIVGFCEDHQGDFYVLDHPAGTIHRMVPNPSRNQSGNFPRKLSETGLFESVTRQVPAPGVIGYSIVAEPWEDHALAKRFVAVPYDYSVDAAKATYSFPKDSVLVKTLSLDLEHQNPATRRLVETQLLHFDGAEWQPYTYQWNDDQSDAALLDAGGAEQTFQVVDQSAPGGVRTHTWRFAGRAECRRCHNKWSGPPLAFNTPQLNKSHDYGGKVADQLATFAHIKLIETPVPSENRPKLTDPYGQSADLNGRARSYLQVNCAHCHRMHAGSAVLSYMHYDLSIDKTNMVATRPTQGTFGIHGAQVIAPGDPFRSVLLYRMAKLGGGRMPHIGSSEVDLAGVELMQQWIQQTPLQSSKNEPAATAAKRLRREAAADLKRLQETPKSDPSEIVDRLLASTSSALLLLRAVDDRTLRPERATLAVTKATDHPDVRIRDLFERFLPAEKRIKRLGGVVRPEQILVLKGSAEEGKKVYFATAGVQCKNCHQVGKEGYPVGPELTAIGRNYNRRELLESILEPSKRIDPKYVTYLAETVEGRLLSGLLVSKSAEEIILKDAQNKQIRIPTADIEQLVPQGTSLMPELLLRDMTAQQVADLLQYLSSLK